MCGIVGFCDYNKKSSDFILRNMTSLLLHRGPDFQDHQLIENSSCSIGLGHTRLSIIDLSSKANQPMEYDNLFMVYNGEIYNYLILKNELIKNGYNFVSNSDSEVVLKSFHFWGEDAISKFNGMFSFCIYDKIKERFFLARDRAGVKPLYYYYRNEIFLFASEIKAFKVNPFFVNELDLDSLGSFINLSYIPTPYTIYKNAFKLEPGCFLIFDIKNKILKKNYYWKVEYYFNIEKNNSPYEKIVSEVKNLLIESIHARLISDVPIGLFLSGGYDSSLLAGIVKKELSINLSSFTVGFPINNYDESERAKNIAKHLSINHEIVTLNPKIAQEILIDFPLIYDEPFANTSGIPTIFLSRIFNENGIKVVLTGDGAEEVFAGYDVYFETSRKIKLMRKLPRSIVFLLYLLYKHDRSSYPNVKWKLLADYFSFKNIPHKYNESLLNIELNIRNDYFNIYNLLNKYNKYFDKKLVADFRTRLLDDFMVKIDRGTMSASVESREPFLDYRLIEYMARVPSKLKCKDNQTKTILKEITYQYVKKSLLDRKKMGFVIPISIWLRNELQHLLNDYINFKNLNQFSYLNTNNILELKNKFLAGKLNDNQTMKLKNLLFFLMWAKKWLN